MRGSTFHTVKTIKALYKVEKDSYADKQAYRRQLRKICFFLVIDLAFTLVSTVVLVLKYRDWTECEKDFNLWAFTLTFCSFASFMLDIWQKSNLQQKQAWIKDAEVISMEKALNRDPYVQYSIKRRLDRITNIQLVISICIDALMIICSGYAIDIGIYAHKVDSICNYPDTRVYVYTMTALAILRCYHLILMTLFVLVWLFFLLPCFFCMPESCCLRRCMIKREQAPKAVTNSLKASWSWQHFLPDD